MRVRTEPPTSKITQNRAAMLRQRMGEVKGKFGQCRKHMMCPVAVANEMSGLKGRVG